MTRTKKSGPCCAAANVAWVRFTGVRSYFLLSRYYTFPALAIHRIWCDSEGAISKFLLRTWAAEEDVAWGDVSNGGGQYFILERVS